MLITGWGIVNPNNLPGSYVSKLSDDPCESNYFIATRADIGIYKVQHRRSEENDSSLSTRKETNNCDQKLQLLSICSPQREEAEERPGIRTGITE